MVLLLGVALADGGGRRRVEFLEARLGPLHDPDTLAERGLQFERLDQLAMEHLLGVRIDINGSAGN